jgi:hypothetical protein
LNEDVRAVIKREYDRLDASAKRFAEAYRVNTRSTIDPKTGADIWAPDNTADRIRKENDQESVNRMVWESEANRLFDSYRGDAKKAIAIIRRVYHAWIESEVSGKGRKAGLKPRGGRWIEAIALKPGEIAKSYGTTLLENTAKRIVWQHYTERYRLQFVALYVKAQNEKRGL